MSMKYERLSIKEFIHAAEEFVKKSDQICDGWTLKRYNHDVHNTFIKKEEFIQFKGFNNNLTKVEYIIFFHLSYGVPCFSFNVWNSSGILLSLEDIRKISLVQMNEKDFYSVITQQEHPVFQKPYFIVHPCHTEELLATFKNKSNNIIVTFLGLITPLISLNLPMEYGL